MLKTAFALALAMLLAGPAAADVLFTFTQTGSTPPGAVSATGTLTISDEAHAAGLDVAREFPGLAPNDLSGTGIFARAAPAPAPAALSLIALGTLALGAARRRRRA